MRVPGDSRQSQIFSKIYENRTWGSARGGEQQFYSGIGSTQKFTKDYDDFVSRFIIDNDIDMVVDLGCGGKSSGAGEDGRVPESLLSDRRAFAA